MENIPATSPDAQVTSMSKKKRIFQNRKVVAGIIVAILVLFLGGSVGVVLLLQQHKTAAPSSNAPDEKIDLASRPSFTEIVLDTYQVQPAVKKYDLGTNFANVTGFNRFKFNANALKKLQQNSFVVVEPTGTDRWGEEFFQVYETNRYNLIPSFITTDSVLHTYHLIFDNALQTLEQATLYDKAVSMSNGIQVSALEQYDYFKRQNNELMANAALRNVAFSTIALQLLGQSSQKEIPQEAKVLVDQELALISAQSEIVVSPLMNFAQGLSAVDALKEDYSQYKPRGHYTKNARLEKYFQAMMWYGRMTFRTKSLSETASALLFTHSIRDNAEISQAWSDIYDVTSFFVGQSDDLSIYDYAQLIAEGQDWRNYGDANVEEFRLKAEKLDGPSINSVPIFEESINPDRKKEIKGFRIMGQRYTLDSDIFQRLVYRDVQKAADGEPRLLPSSLDLLAAFGSAKAQTILEADNVNRFPNYNTNLTAAKSLVSQYTTANWTSNLYSMWLYMIRPFTNTLGEGYPQFMQNSAWVAKDMNTFQGSWTELRHDTIMYVKQSYAELGGGGMPVFDDRGYVEPRYDVYAALESLAKATKSGLEQRGLLDFDYSYTDVSDSYCDVYDKQAKNCKYTYKFDGANLAADLDKLTEMSTNLKEITKLELGSQPLSEQQYDFIYSYGGQLEHLWFRSINKEKGSTADVYENLNDNPVMLVADVATDPNGKVLEEGTGHLMEIYVIIPLPGYEGNYYRIARGFVWSQYEFSWPMNDRLNDKQWQQMVRNNQEPSLADWKLEYLVPKSSVKIEYAPMVIDDTDREFCTNYGGQFKQHANLCAPDQQGCEYADVTACYYYQQ